MSCWNLAFKDRHSYSFNTPPLAENIRCTVLWRAGQTRHHEYPTDCRSERRGPPVPAHPELRRRRAGLYLFTPPLLLESGSPPGMTHLLPCLSIFVLMTCPTCPTRLTRPTRHSENLRNCSEKPLDFRTHDSLKYTSQDRRFPMRPRSALSNFWRD